MDQRSPGTLVLRSEKGVDKSIISVEYFRIFELMVRTVRSLQFSVLG